MINEILEELNLENGSNYKIKVLQKYKDNELLKRVLKLTYDKVQYVFGITMRNINYTNISESLSLEQALDILETEFCTSDVTGNAAIERLTYVLSNLSEINSKIIEKIISRDLKLNLGKTQINKVFKDLIIRPTYMRCDTYSPKTAKNIQYPAIVQLKADGTYREFTVIDGEIQSRSRSGEDYEYPVIFEQMKDFPNGVYVGELTVRGCTDRQTSNGLINSDNPPHDDIIVELWDYITLDEYQLASKKDKKNVCTTIYLDRFRKLKDIYTSTSGISNISIIPFKVVNNLQEALKQTSEWMSQGFEGSILKDNAGVFKDGTSKHQLKIKLEISVEVRCTGFTEGTKGTKREHTFGAMTFENDEGTIKGQCSGFTDAQLEDFNSRREEIIGKIIEVQFNDLTKAEGNDYYALSHPRFIEIRLDKDETDSLEKAFKLREMAMNLESK